MEINYDMILKYLGSEKESFDNKKNLIKFSDGFPQTFKDLFGDKFYRVGVTQTQDNINVSFLTSFLSLLTEDYITLLDKEETTYINKLTDELTNYLNTNDLSLIFKGVPKNILNDLSKNMIKKKIKDNETCIWLLELLVNKFEINLLIFDFNVNQIYTVYPSDIMNPWKPFFLFAKSNNNWEPIRNQDKKLFSYNDIIIKKALSSQNIEIQYYENNLIKKDYFLLDNINEIIATDFSNNNLEITNEEDSENKLEEDSENKMDVDSENKKELNSEINKTFIKKIVIINKAKLNKMTKEEIITYMKELNKNIVTTKKTTKKELIELVLEN